MPEPPYPVEQTVEDDLEWSYFVGDDDDVEPPGAEVVSSDPAVIAAGERLIELFASRPDEVFYERQIAVMLEGDFFHWVTSRALKGLLAEGRIAVGDLHLERGWPLPPFDMRFFHNRKNRYWKRHAKRVGRLVLEFSDPAVTRAVGLQGETLFDAALPGAGFLPSGRNVRAYREERWTQTGHNLDRIFERDGVAYGAEIKNTLPYIGRDELEVKIQMCKALGLKPLFIARMLPKTYINDIVEAGGYALIFKYQLYPFGHADLARRIRTTLGIPADSPRALAEGTIQRFLNWHLKTKHLPPKR